MKNYHCLTFDSTRKDLLSVVDYEMGDFKLTNFWGGKQNISLSDSVQLFIDSTGNSPDLMGNPVSWLICSEKLISLISSVTSDGFEIYDAPLFDSKTKKTVAGYSILNVYKKIPCLDLEKSSVDWSSDHKEITAVYEHVFCKDKIPEDCHIFRPSEWPFSVVLSDKLAKSFIGKDLTGVAFIKSDCS